MKELKRFFLSLITICIFSESIYSQEFRQLIIEDNLATEYLSHIPRNERRLNAFGNFRYNLLLSYDENSTRVENRQYNWIKSDIDKETYWLFSVLEAEKGTINFLNMDLHKFYPISFLNDDTLILKHNDADKYIGYRFSDSTFVDLNKNLEKLLFYIPSDYYFKYRFKINNSNDKMLLFKEDDLITLKVFIVQNDDVVVRDIVTDVYFVDWKFLDFFWIDNENILLFLTKPVDRGISYSQKIFNISNDKIINLPNPGKGYQIDDYCNGYCLIRTGKKPQAYVYKLEFVKGCPTLCASYQIEVKEEIYNPLFEIGFVSKSTLARITNIEAEKGFFSILLNLNSNMPLQMEISELH